MTAVQQIRKPGQELSTVRVLQDFWRWYRGVKKFTLVVVIEQTCA